MVQFIFYGQIQIKSCRRYRVIRLTQKFIRGNNVKSCNEQLARLRRKGERNLKCKGKQVGYSAKLLKEPKNALATYNIFTKGKKYSGDYTALCQRLGSLSKKD